MSSTARAAVETVDKVWPATQKESFELLYEMLKAYYTGFLDSAFKVAGFYLLAIGWVITSHDARDALRTDDAARQMALIGATLGWLLYAVISVRVLGLSHQTFRLLTKVAYMDIHYVENHRIKRLTWLLFVGGILSLSWLLQYLIFGLKSDAHPLIEMPMLLLGPVLYSALALYVRLSKALMTDDGSSSAPRSDAPYTSR